MNKKTGWYDSIPTGSFDRQGNYSYGSDDKIYGLLPPNGPVSTIREKNEIEEPKTKKIPPQTKGGSDGRSIGTERRVFVLSASLEACFRISPREFSDLPKNRTT